MPTTCAVRPTSSVRRSRAAPLLTVLSSGLGSMTLPAWAQDDASTSTSISTLTAAPARDPYPLLEVVDQLAQLAQAAQD